MAVPTTEFPGILPELSNRNESLHPTIAELLRPWRSPENENAVPAGPRNGVETSAAQKNRHAHVSTETDLIPALDLPLPVTLFRALTDTTPVHETLSLRQFVERMGRVAPVEKAQLPLLKLGTFKSGRKREHLVSRHGVEIDYDAGEVSPEEAASRLRAAGVAAVVFTSSSHTPEKPRWRVLAPTSAPVDPEAAQALVERINGALGGIAGKESFDSARCYYYGRVCKNDRPEVYLIDGRPIDKADELCAASGKTARLCYIPKSTHCLDPTNPRLCRRNNALCLFGRADPCGCGRNFPR